MIRPTSLRSLHPPKTHMAETYDSPTSGDSPSPSETEESPPEIEGDNFVSPLNWLNGSESETEDAPTTTDEVQDQSRNVPATRTEDQKPDADRKPKRDREKVTRWDVRPGQCPRPQRSRLEEQPVTTPTTINACRNTHLTDKQGAKSKEGRRRSASQQHNSEKRHRVPTPPNLEKDDRTQRRSLHQPGKNCPTC